MLFVIASFDAHRNSGKLALIDSASALLARIMDTILPVSCVLAQYTTPLLVHIGPKGNNNK